MKKIAFVSAAAFAFAIGVAGCGSSSDVSAKNAQFLAALPGDLDPSARRLFQVLIDRGNSHALNRFHGQFYGLVRTLYEANGKLAESAVAMDAWRYYEVLAIDVLPEVRWPSGALYAMNWKPGYVVVPRIEPAPTSMDYISDLPPSTCLILEMVPIDTASNRKYRISAQTDKPGT